MAKIIKEAKNIQYLQLKISQKEEKQLKFIAKTLQKTKKNCQYLWLRYDRKK